VAEFLSLGPGVLGYGFADLHALWNAQAVLDAVRTGAWLLFLGVVLQGNRFGRKAAPALLLLPVAACVNGNLSRTAELLGISRPTLYDLLNRFGLKEASR
jgi:transcriptional regulator of acetoin/glycerol metabolism